MSPSEEILQALVQECQKGNTEAYREVYDLLITDLYRYLYAKVQKEDREDLSADIFLKAWENIHRYTAQTNVSFRSWFFTIAHNIVIDYYRKFHECDTIDETLQIADESEDGSPEKEVNRTLNAAYLTTALQHLKKEHEQIISLKYLSEFSNSEIAQIMGKSETAIRIILHRALKQLKTIIEE